MLPYVALFIFTLLLAECDVALQVMEVSGQLTKLLEVQEEGNY